jgi:hypothetical protein
MTANNCFLLYFTSNGRVPMLPRNRPKLLTPKPDQVQ